MEAPFPEMLGELGLEQPGQVTVSPVRVGLTKNPLQLIAPANKKRAAKKATT
jgi:hypothetical protein